MSGPLVWWANRKSRIGVSVAARKPPHVDGKEWFTVPPVSAPEPAYIEYAVQYLAQLQAMSGSRHRIALIKYVSEWIRKARQLLHERVESERGDLHTTDGILIATAGLLHAVFSRLNTLGGGIDPSWREIQQAVNARAAESRRRRAQTLKGNT